MRWLLKVLALLLSIPILIIVAVMAASELGGEVVVLHTLDTRGGDSTTSLWVIEDSHSLYLRAGDPQSTWLLRLLANPNVELEREGQRLSYRASPAPQYRDEINDRMAEKYGWADRLVSLVRDPLAVTAVQLERN